MKKLREHPYYRIDWARLPATARNDIRMDAFRWCSENVEIGDKITVARCGGYATVRFAGWHGITMTSQALLDISPLSVLKRNREFVFPFGNDVAAIEGYYA